jgi:hypothetical protein
LSPAQRALQRVPRVACSSWPQDPLPRERRFLSAILKPGAFRSMRKIPPPFSVCNLWSACGLMSSFLETSTETPACLRCAPAAFSQPPPPRVCLTHTHTLSAHTRIRKRSNGGGSGGMGVQQRRSILRSKYGFVCDCTLCVREAGP